MPQPFRLNAIASLFAVLAPAAGAADVRKSVV